MTITLYGPYRRFSPSCVVITDARRICVGIHEEESSFFVRGSREDLKTLVAILLEAIGPEPPNHTYEVLAQTDTRAADELTACTLDEARDVLADLKGEVD